MQGRRVRTLTATAASLALVGAAAIYASIGTGLPAGAVAPTKSPVFAVRTAPATSQPGKHEGAAAPAATSASSPSLPAAVPPAAPPPLRVSARTGAPFSPVLDADVNGIIAANSRIAVGVALIDVTDGAVHEYGDRTKFVAASTAKILTAAAYYHLVETGRASLATRLGAASAGVQIRQMVQQSNNDSWALILGAVGQPGMTAYAASLGIAYDSTVNLLTPAETARTLALLYTGKLLNRQNTAQLLSYMQRTNYDALIPAAVPPGIEVFHKYGWLSGNLHDASILVRDGKAYVFVVYTLALSGSDTAAPRRIIHQLTQTVTAYLF